MLTKAATMTLNDEMEKEHQKYLEEKEDERREKIRKAQMQDSKLEICERIAKDCGNSLSVGVRTNPIAYAVRLELYIK